MRVDLAYTDEYPLLYRPNGIEDVLEEHIKEVMKAHHEHLEKFAAAFLKHVGATDAVNYRLIEKREGLQTSWYFERKEECK